ncbi:MAG: sigma-70 family RNA polymerase sigma factor [Ruminococcaceae bacterium]|nr:sigma-70 family RNA polymerase sigma factor [Oscillospiraceae bacterium]
MINKDEFIEKNIGLVHSCCSKFKGKGIEYEDMFQAGCIGLIKATAGFDESRGLQFSTYAVPVILGEIKRMFRDGGSVKVGRTLKELSLKVTRENERLSKVLDRDPTVTEIAESLKVSVEEVTEALCAAQPTLSLTVESEDGVSELDIATDSGNDKLIEHISLSEVMKKLEDNDRKLIYLRYYKSKTQSETAKHLGMTQVQVSRRERVILTKMRQLLA